MPKRVAQGQRGFTLF